ncbi:MAG: hypothetical protein LBE82_11745 [Chitinophagaceae bacterium]|jgi:hypothetical protein|nr:hypothetical protein [Chitinophagaceae bacterium]
MNNEIKLQKKNLQIALACLETVEYCDIALQHNPTDERTLDVRKKSIEDYADTMTEIAQYVMYKCNAKFVKIEDVLSLIGNSVKSENDLATATKLNRQSVEA